MKKLLFILAFLPLVGFSQTKMIVNYVKTDSIKARSNWVEVIDSTNYHKDLYVRDTSIVDLIVKYAAEDVVNIGSANQIPFVNALGTDLDYSPNFKWNDTTFIIFDNFNNINIGLNAGKNSNSEGGDNIFIGENSGLINDDGIYNVCIGSNAGYSLVSGGINTFIGANAGYNNYGGDNTFLGGFSGTNNLSGSGNIFIGKESGYNETGSNKLYIDNSNTSNPLIKGDFATDELWLNTDTTHIVGHLAVDSNLYVFGRSILEKYEVAARVPVDSTLQTSVTSTWQFLGSGDNNKFVNKYIEGFTFDGDTLVFQQQSNDLRDSIEFHLDWSTVSAASNNGVIIFYGIFIKSVGDSVYSESKPHTMQNKMQTSGDLYSWANSTYPIFLKDGDKIQIRIRSASTSTTVTTERFNIYLREQ